jgi:hypothetical protein
VLVLSHGRLFRAEIRAGERSFEVNSPGWTIERPLSAANTVVMPVRAPARREHAEQRD